MSDKKNNKKSITDAYERSKESNAMDDNEKYYRGKNNGLATDEDDLPDRNLKRE